MKMATQHEDTVYISSETLRDINKYNVGYFIWSSFSCKLHHTSGCIISEKKALPLFQCVCRLRNQNSTRSTFNGIFKLCGEILPDSRTEFLIFNFPLCQHHKCNSENQGHTESFVTKLLLKLRKFSKISSSHGSKVLAGYSKCKSTSPVVLNPHVLTLIVNFLLLIAVFKCQKHFLLFAILNFFAYFHWFRISIMDDINRM